MGAAPLWIAALVVAILGAALLLDRSASNSGHPTLGAFPGDVEVARAGGESIDGPIERLDGDGPRREEVAPDATIPSSDVATRPAPLSTVRLADVASEESGPRGELEVLCLQDGSSAPAPGWPLTVTSLDARWLPRSVRRRDADAQGRARWADLPAGRYAVEGQRFEVAAGRRSRVEVAVPWSSTLRGRVVDGDGRPVGGARVLGAPGPPALTDGDGRFEVRGVEQIAWLHAERAGFRRSDVAVLSLAHARGGDEVALTMRRGGAVLTGRLLDADGSPVEGATVRASEQERYEAEDGLDYNQCSYGSVTDREGRFRFGGLLSVPLDLSSNVGPLGSAGLRVDVEAEAEIERDLVLAPRLDVHGVVRDRRGRPVAGASVALYGRDSHEHRFTATDADGRYRVRGAPHPVTHVSSSHDTGGQVRFEPSLSESGVAQLDIELPRDVADLSSSLRGEVLDASGAPLVGWCVYALRDDGWRLIGPTDDEGGFRGVRGTDDLRHLAVSRDERRRFVQVFPDAAIPVGSATLRVTRPFGAIRGRVEDRVGGLPGGATVQLGLGAVVLETRTVEEGAASFEWRDLTPGTYWVRFLAEGRATRVIPVRIEPGETLELGALVSSRGGRLELDVDGPLLAVALDRPGVATPSVRTEPGATTLEALPVGENTVTVFAPGSGVRSIQVVIEEGRTTRSAVALAPGLRREVRVRIDGCPVEDLTWTRPGVLYVLEDAETGAFVVGASAATDGSGVELLPLAAGRYRLRMSTFEGQSGDAVLDVSDRTVAEPVEIDLLSPGL
ncbi:MAG: carboxypeptidase-like regulatory domain-containing protein [Planctomycetota bacterium]